MTAKRKILLGLALLPVLLLLAAAAGWWWLTSSGRPQREGVASIPGLGAAVEVRFDRWGVPHVEAASPRDAAAAQGWLHANDRMAQLELGRRAAAGRLSEVVGTPTLAFDRGARELRLRWAAENLWQAAGGESRELLEAYAAGVNAWLAARGGDLPPDLKLLGVDPEPWTPVDSLGFVLLMARDLSFWNGRPEATRYRWLAAFGLEKALDLLGDPEVHVPPAILAMATAKPPEPRVFGDETGASGETAQSAALPLPWLGAGAPPPGAPAPALGSNNWALGSSWTASGSPLVANDPHLGFRLPGTWYQVLLRSPGYEVSGMSLPGLPGVVIGRSQHLAWALTNVMLDDHDLFFEKLDPTGTRVLRGEEWVEVTVDPQTVLVKGGEPVELGFRHTDVGPFLIADPERGLPARSLAWTAYLPADPLRAVLGLARARTLEEAHEAIADFVVPAQNLVVGQVDGGVMHAMLGRVPNRRTGDGRFPAPAWDPAYGWDGLRPAETDPVTSRPQDDLVVTANHDARPADYPLPLSADFDTAHRASRIRELVTARRGWDAAGNAGVQTDVVSLYARELVSLGAGSWDGAAGQAHALLAGWDGSMTGGPAALFALYERCLYDHVLEDEAEAAGVLLSTRERLLRALGGEMSPAWLDDVRTPQAEDREALLGRCLAGAWNEAVGRWGGDSQAWSYGRLHTLLLRHPLGVLPGIGSAFNRGPYPVDGSSTAVAAFGDFWDGDALSVAHGPSMRWIVDLGRPDGGLAVLPGGQSGHPWDRHYDDQIPLYLAGETRGAPWSPEAVRAATVSVLLLEP